MPIKVAIAFVLLSITLISCDRTTDRYYISKKSKLLGYAGADYTLAEKRNDSLQVWYITDDINAGYFERYKSETLPFKAATGKQFSIRKIKNGKIIGDGITLTKVSDINKYFRLRNEVSSNVIDYAFNDSIKRILQVKYPNIVFTHKIRDDKVKAALVSNTHCDSFPGIYRLYLQANLESVREEAISKRNFYNDIVNGKTLLDSAMFDKFLSNYENSFYDQRVFYHIIKEEPELFFLQIHLSTVELDVCYCPECFTKDELDEMYCKLKPFRQRNPQKLWMFERHGNLKCQGDLSKSSGMQIL